MKKKILFGILTAMILLVFCGCGNFDIKCSIDKNNVAEMTIDISLPTDELSENERIYMLIAINKLKTHWQKNEFVIQEDEQESSYSLTAIKSKECNDTQEAFTELVSMMSDDCSPFSYVSGGYSPSYFNNLYNIDAKIDLRNIIDIEFVESLPYSQQEKINESLESFAGKIVFDMFGETIEYVGTYDGSQNSVLLSLDSPSEIFSLVQTENIENQAAYQTLKDEQAVAGKEKKLYLILTLLAGGLLMGLAAGAVSIMVTRKKRNSIPPEPNEDTQP